MTITSTYEKLSRCYGHPTKTLSMAAFCTKPSLDTSNLSTKFDTIREDDVAHAVTEVAR